MLYDIELTRMEFRAYHGCYDLEQQVGNRFTVDLVITAELGDGPSSGWPPTSSRRSTPTSPKSGT